MKIGFIRGLNAKSEMVEICDKLVYADSRKPISENVIEFIEEYFEEELVFQSLIELRLQISQLLPIMEKVYEKCATVRFLDKGHMPHMTERDYIRILLTISRQEKEIRSICTKESLARVRREGIAIGRPTIQTTVVDKIDFLYNNQGKSIREVAAICEVSVGTVHKYLKKVTE
ncbi:recombinase family protein [Vagococcus sp. BWB3-3]|uniref:Recombinase family protein n=1 Tax=Vagococcus allomyrinae TaxID=2794353 RepID=A0A940P4K3_9ENTE|nr:recombinase family protein [Vagococcus allomyrinae]MBP1039616.1 recombinase family protein [Vagococcus allomyrinae]